MAHSATAIAPMPRSTVPGVGQQRQGPGQQTGDDLGHHERGQQEQRHDQVASVGPRSRPVRVTAAPAPAPAGPVPMAAPGGLAAGPVAAGANPLAAGDRLVTGRSPHVRYLPFRPR